MNKTWVDHWMQVLSSHQKDKKRKISILFEPTPVLYKKLESGDDSDLEAVAGEMSRYIGLNNAPAVVYEWSLKMKPEAAGQIRYSGSTRSQIQIPIFYVGKPYELGAILAHELTHEFFACEGITCDNAVELEQLTDLASISFGLGKLVRNGTVAIVVPATGEHHVLGYLTPELKAYTYQKINKKYKIRDVAAKEYLTENALRILKAFI